MRNLLLCLKLTRQNAKIGWGKMQRRRFKRRQILFVREARRRVVNVTMFKLKSLLSKSKRFFFIGLEAFVVCLSLCRGTTIACSMKLGSHVEYEKSQVLVFSSSIVKAKRSKLIFLSENGEQALQQKILRDLIQYEFIAFVNSWWWKKCWNNKPRNLIKYITVALLLAELVRHPICPRKWWNNIYSRRENFPPSITKIFPRSTSARSFWFIR